MDNIDLRIENEISKEKKEKGFYQKMEDSYYNTLDKINKSIPIYKIIDPIDKVMPSFILINILLFLFVVAIVGLVVFLVLNSGMKVDIEFYYDNNKINEDFVVNIIYDDFDSNFNVENSLLTIKLKEELKIKLRVLTEGYEFERSYVITGDYIKVNIPKKVVIDTTPKKISIFAYESPNQSKIYSESINLSLKCLSSGTTANFVLNSTKEYERLYECGNIKFTGNVSGFRNIDYTCMSNEVVCAIPLTKVAEPTPKEVDLTPKNNLEVYVKDDKNNILENVVVSLSKGSTIIPDKNTDLYGKAIYPNLPVGTYELELNYDFNNYNEYLKDSNVYIEISNLPIRKNYYLSLDKNYETESTLNLYVDTFDTNDTRFDLHLYDINGNEEFSQKNKSVPEEFSTNLLSGNYYISAIPSKDYNPIYFTEFELFQDTNIDVIFEEYDNSKFFELAVYGDDIAGAKVFIKEIDNNNLVYDSKIADSDDRAFFTLYNDRDYFVEVIKNNYIGYGMFDSSDIEDNKGSIEISLEKMEKEISFEFTLDNKKVDYMVFIEADDDTNYSGNGKINFEVPTGEEIEMHIVAEDTWDIYTYFLSPMIFLDSETYNLKYNYDTDLNIKITDLKLDQFLQKDVNDLNLIANKEYYFGLETKLNCANNKVTRDIPHHLTTGFDLVSKNDYLDLGNNLLSLSVTNTSCRDGAISYHYIFNSILGLTANNSGLEGYFEYDEYLDKNIYFKVPGSYSCDVSLNTNAIEDLSEPYIISTNSKINFSEDCGGFSVNNEPYDVNYIFEDVGKYTINYGNNAIEVYVLEEYESDLEADEFEEIKVLYDNEVDCTEYYCSVEQLANYNLSGFEPIYLLDDNFFVLDGNVYFKEIGSYDCLQFESTKYCSLNKLIPQNHIFYYLPYRTSDFLNTIFNEGKYGTSSETVFYWDSGNGIPYITDDENPALYNINYNSMNGIYNVLFAKNNNNIIDLNISQGIEVLKCDDITKCYAKAADYFLYANNKIYLINEFLDINNVSKSISFKAGFEDLGEKEIVYIFPSLEDPNSIYKIDSLQDVIDNYNNGFIKHNSTNNEYLYYWDIEKILLLEFGVQDYTPRDVLSINTIPFNVFRIPFNVFRIS